MDNIGDRESRKTLRSKCRMKASVIRTFIVCSLPILCCSASLLANQPEVVTLTEARALRPIIFELRIPLGLHDSLGASPGDAEVTLGSRKAGPAMERLYPEEVVDDNGVLTFGPLPSPHTPPLQVRQTSGYATITTPILCAWRGLGKCIFAFPESGTYELEWTIRLRGSPAPLLSIRHTIEIGEPCADDVAFLEALSGEQLWSQILPGESDKYRREYNATSQQVQRFEKFGLRLLTTIFQWSADPHVRPLSDEERILAAPLLAIARMHPTSSYTPYAYCYAAAPFLDVSSALYAEQRELFKGSATEISRTAANRAQAAVESEPSYQNAIENLTHVVEHGDSFIRPRAVLELAQMRALAGNLQEARRLLEAVRDEPEASKLVRQVQQLEQRLTD